MHPSAAGDPRDAGWGRGMIAARRICQIGAIAVLLVVPMISRGGALYEAYGAGASHVKELTTPWQYFLYTAFGTVFGGFDDPVAVADLFQGSFWSITLFGITINDPLAALGHMAATLSVHWPLVLGALTPLVIAAFAGRAFCGWVCPINSLLEVNAALRRWIERRIVRFRLPRFTVAKRLRYVVLLAGLAVSLAGAFNVFPLILPYVALAREWHLGVYGLGLGFGVVFVVALMAVELVLAPHLWCRSLCPTGLVLGLTGRLRVLGIRKRPERSCVDRCSLCIAVCPVGVNPRDGIATEQCMSCNACVAQCPAQVLELTVVRPRRGPMRTVGRAAGVALLLTLGASTADAHHIAGMPHYGYLENYPQTPTREERAVAPPYSVTVVAYVLEGLDRSKSESPDDVMVYVTVTDERSKKAYTGEIEVAFRPDGGGDAISRSFTAPLEETVYRMRVTLPASDYDLAVRIGGADGTTATLKLPVDVSRSFAWLTTSLIVTGAAAVFVAFVYLRRRHRARPAAAVNRP